MGFVPLRMWWLESFFWGSFPCEDGMWIARRFPFSCLTTVRSSNGWGSSNPPLGSRAAILAILARLFSTCFHSRHSGAASTPVWSGHGTRECHPCAFYWKAGASLGERAGGMVMTMIGVFQAKHLVPVVVSNRIQWFMKATRWVFGANIYQLNIYS